MKSLFKVNDIGKLFISFLTICFIFLWDIKYNFFSAKYLFLILIFPIVYKIYLEIRNRKFKFVINFFYISFFLFLHLFINLFFEVLVKLNLTLVNLQSILNSTVLDVIEMRQVFGRYKKMLENKLLDLELALLSQGTEDERLKLARIF